MKALLLGFAALVATPVTAQTPGSPQSSTLRGGTFAITGGTVAIGDGSAPIQNGTVVFRDGRIVAAGQGIAVPAGATVIDAAGKWVAAGMVAGFSDLGLLDVNGVEESNDSAARTSPFAAAIDIAPAINPQAVMIDNERLGGITRAIVTPSSAGSIFAGQGAVIDLGADADPITRARAFQFVELGENGASDAGGSRPAAYAMLRDAFAQAQDYRRNPAGFGGREKDSLLKRGDAIALGDVLDGKTRLLVHVERASDIRSVLALKQDFPKLDLVLVGAAEGWMVARDIAAARVPVIAGALADLPAKFESLAATESNVGRMEAAGVTVALSTVGANTAPGDHVVRQYAGNLVGIAKVPGSSGLDWGHAFAAITSGPAQAIGMDGDIGSLRAGRRADVVIWDGDPLELSSAPVAVYIDGRAHPMTSRQTQLRDRYMTPSEGALPKAYEH
ncbi:amidohydrolase family protein [Sphingomonas oligophenolica]|uniref:Amidohydrolase n=1 Tax=Sphingomonas oligophenolica TaxID=301154 RepID=A0A502CDC5_9SPHN|nr:amidohydrolase family protein [Sphingomonas oligophenolica]TPG10793.1 amidohydrolase [Sphingomonas oligophenolica]